MNSHRNLRCPRCGSEADRDTVAVMNIERIALSKMGVTSDRPDCPADDRSIPEQMRGTSEPPKGSPCPLGRGGGQVWGNEDLKYIRQVLSMIDKYIR